MKSPPEYRDLLHYYDRKRTGSQKIDTARERNPEPLTIPAESNVKAAGADFLLNPFAVFAHR
jgi:hypothetical protein